MSSIAALVTWTDLSGEPNTLESVKECSSINSWAIACLPGVSPPSRAPATIETESLWSKSSVLDILQWFENTQADYLLWIFPGAPVLSSRGLERIAGCARDTGAALAYSDYLDLREDGKLINHPLIDYQAGSLRDDFDFGPVVLLSKKKLSKLASEIEKDSPELRYAGWYDLRLRLSEKGSIFRLSEATYQCPVGEERASGQRVFDYVDPSRRDYQAEMETVATDYLRRIGAWLEPPTAALPVDDRSYPVRASVVIPVKNRARTIADAVGSALSQKTSFDFNVIVVDNHSQDGTTEALNELARDDRLVHIIPKRRDLQIGGCWNEAIHSDDCGRIAVQLDSDDLYDGTAVLERIVGEMEKGFFALLIGSYTTVDFDLQTQLPGVVDHREWTDANGHNNALRIAGLGAPRAYHVPTLRALGFPNVSYGEDYAAVLRLCGIYPMGRIYESLYWCRRWEGNSDSALSLEVSNRYASYKDTLRTIEIAARRQRGG